MENLRMYFETIAPIWEAFNEGRIGAEKREQMLRPYRKELPSLPASPWASGFDPFK